MSNRHVDIEVMAPGNKKVMRRYRIRPPRIPGKPDLKTVFTPEGVDQALDAFIEQVDNNNPNHKWRLVEMVGNRFRLVWDDTRTDQVSSAPSD